MGNIIKLPEAVRIGQVKRAFAKGDLRSNSDLGKDWGFTARQVSSMKPGASKPYGETVAPCDFDFSWEEWKATPEIYSNGGKMLTDRNNPQAVMAFICDKLSIANRAICKEFGLDTYFIDMEEVLERYITKIYAKEKAIIDAVQHITTKGEKAITDAVQHITIKGEIHDNRD